MQKENSLERFTEGECILLASLSRQYFETIELKKQLIKDLPKESQVKIREMQEKMEFAYAILLKNANDMFDVNENPLAFGFGFVMMSINELDALKNEEAKDSILNKLNEYLMPVPEWVIFVNAVKNNKTR